MKDSQLSAGDNQLSEREIRRVAEQVAAGQVIGYPTETVWGLAAAPEHALNLQRRKGRDAAKPLQVSCAEIPTALSLAQEHPLLASLALFWPGPLTVITRARDRCPAALAPGGLVGLRLPDHPVAQQLLKACGPLATSSLNPAGQPAALTFAQARAYGLADVLLGGSQDVAGGLASTVVELLAPSEKLIRVIRVGALAVAQLERVLAPQGVRVQWGPPHE